MKIYQYGCNKQCDILSYKKKTQTAYRRKEKNIQSLAKKGIEKAHTSFRKYVPWINKYVWLLCGISSLRLNNKLILEFQTLRPKRH